MSGYIKDDTKFLFSSDPDILRTNSARPSVEICCLYPDIQDEVRYTIAQDRYTLVFGVTPIRSSYHFNSASSPALIFSAFLHPCPSPSKRIYLTFLPLSSNERKMVSAWDGGTTASSDPWRIYAPHDQSPLPKTGGDLGV